MTQAILDTAAVDRLATLVEEATRATRGTPERFVEPARGTLDRAKSRRHHIVFGRRGSGKTSMLRKAQADLTLDRKPVAFVDLETYKEHSYPDVLLSVLVATFQDFASWLNSAGLHPSTKRSFWQRLFGAAPRRPPLPKARVGSLSTKLVKQIEELKTLLYAQDDAELNAKTASSTEAVASRDARLAIKGPSLEAGIGSKGETKAHGSIEITESSRRSKVDFLHRHIMDYQALVDELVELAGGDSFIFLDDLYHLRRPDQARVVDYFHRIAKGRSLWLKIGTIKHRSEWYRHGEPPIGMKLGDDCDEIDLDISLEKYRLAKDFLYKVLEQLVIEAGLKTYHEVLAEGAVDRLVLVSGGVVRDFLTIFRRSIDHARERGVNQRGPRIGAEDVNAAAGEHDTSKREELRRDTHEERETLEDALAKVQAFCIQNKVNVLLVERDRDTFGNRTLGELIDLRFLHLAASRVTVRDEPGALFSCFLLDVSQYTGERKRREMELVEFWTRRGLDRVRRRRYVFDPDTAFPPGAVTAIALLPAPRSG
jgi:hypothetical protein